MSIRAIAEAFRDDPTPRLSASSLHRWLADGHVDEGMLRYLGWEYPDGWDRDIDPGPPVWPGVMLPGPDGYRPVVSVYEPRRPLTDDELALVTAVADMVRAMNEPPEG